MKRRSLGLLGRIFAILVLTIAIEFAASTFLYERASRYSVREDEAHRLAEHLVISAKLLSERPVQERPAMASELTTNRYQIKWSATPPAMPPIAPALDEMRRQIITWEPALATTDVRLRLTSPGRYGTVSGALRLPDGSWMRFKSAGIATWDLAVGRILLALVPAAALIILAGLLLQRALRSTRDLAIAAGRIGHGETLVLPEIGPAETRRLIRAFNEMQHRIHQLIDDRTQALAAVGHDLRTPLARLQLRAEGIEDPELRRSVAQDVEEMDTMLSSLLIFLRGEDDPEPAALVDIAVLAQTMVDDAADLGGDLTYEGPDHLAWQVRPSAFKRALGNLIDNACQYGDQATVIVEDRADEVVVRVEDDGPGIPEGSLSEVLRPFTRLDAARARNTKGLGLGLAIVARSVELEKGRLTLANRPEGGLAVEIGLPKPVPLD